MKLCMVVCIVMAGLFAQSIDTGPAPQSFMVTVHDTNQVKMTISNFGKFGQSSSGTAGCWWPKSTTHNYIFGDGFWFGTIEQGTGDTLVSIGYGPHGGESEVAPGLTGMDPSHPCAVIYINPENWPVPHDTFPMAPQELISHEDSWCCYNDGDSIYHMPGDGRPIGIEVYQTGYEWMRTEVQDIFFMTYEFKNVSGHALNNCYLGIVTDNDIGNESGTGANDVYAGILERDYTIGNTVYHADNIAYQWQNQAEPGWSTYPGVMGFDLLQTPFDLVPNCDKDNDGILDQYEQDSAYYAHNVPPSQWDVDQDYVPDWRDASENPQKGMTALKQFTLNLEPNLDHERYLTLAGYNFQTGAYEPFDTLPVTPDDQRFLMASGPLTIPEDSIQTFVFAVMFANWHDIYGFPDTALVLVDYWAQRYYDMSWFHYTAIEEHASDGRSLTQFSIRPNPVTKQGIIRFGLVKPAVVEVRLFDAAGRLVREVLHGALNAGIHDLKMDISKEPSGAYFLVLESDGQCATRQLVIVR